MCCLIEINGDDLFCKTIQVVDSVFTPKVLTPIHISYWLNTPTPVCYSFTQSAIVEEEEEGGGSGITTPMLIF